MKFVYTQKVNQPNEKNSEDILKGLQFKIQEYRKYIKERNIENT